jgi:hypothetical protein
MVANKSWRAKAVSDLGWGSTSLAGNDDDRNKTNVPDRTCECNCSSLLLLILDNYGKPLFSSRTGSRRKKPWPERKASERKMMRAQAYLQPRQIPSTQNRNGMTAWGWGWSRANGRHAFWYSRDIARLIVGSPGFDDQDFKFARTKSLSTVVASIVLKLSDFWRLQGETSAHPIIKDRYQHQSSVQSNCSRDFSSALLSEAESTTDEERQATRCRFWISSRCVKSIFRFRHHAAHGKSVSHHVVQHRLLQIHIASKIHRAPRFGASDDVSLLATSYADLMFEYIRGVRPERRFLLP